MSLKKARKGMGRLTCLGSMLLALAAAVPVWADSWEEHRTGSLTVNASYVTGSGASQIKNPVKDVEISLYQVAEASKEGGVVGYKSRLGLERYEPDFNNGFSGEENSVIAEAISRLESLESYQIQTVKTNEEGKAVFPDLEPGMYLVMQSAPRKGFYDMGSFLAAVPAAKADGSGWIYEVEAMPKLEKRPEDSGGGDHGGGGNSGGGGGNPTPPKDPVVPSVPELPEDSVPGNPPEDFPGGKLPQTGMHRSWMLALLCVGAACIGMGWKSSRKLFFSLGILGILGAGMMEGKDILEDRMAGAVSAEAIREIESWMEQEAAGDGSLAGTMTGIQNGSEPGLEEVPDEPDRKAASLAEGSGYTGILSIPSLGLELPVQDQWSYPALRKTPCRYYGAAQSDDLVVFAHNYARHFGTIKDMEAEDEVLFTDMDGQLHTYAVDEVMVISPYEAEAMTAGDWDLILFTCTYGGENRVAVRCREVMEEALEQSIMPARRNPVL